MRSIIKLLLKLIFEILIAILIFVLLAKYTPLFDNIMQNYFGYNTKQDWYKWSELTFYDNQEDGQNNFFQKINSKWSASAMWQQAEDLDLIKDLLYSDINSTANKNKSIKLANNLWDLNKIDSSYQPCKLPRSDEYVPHWRKVTAYNKDIASDANICQWQLRTCNDWILDGEYMYPGCYYEIDGVRNGKETKPWALSTTHNLFQTVKWSEYPEEFLKSTRYESKYNIENPYPTNLRWQMEYYVENKWSTYRDAKKPNIVENYKPEDLLTIKQNKKSDCMSPRWETIKHWDFVLAYNRSVANVWEACIFEKRACIDGKLFWWNQYKECIDTTNPNYDIPTELIYEDNTQVWNFKKWNPISDEMIELWIDNKYKCNDCFATWVLEEPIIIVN